ncbi:MAG: sodium:calcium antiporter [Candidatus Micrarchaeota archaeon]
MNEWFLPFLLLAGSVVVIFKAGEKTTTYAALLARQLGVSDLAIGFILLSAATSLPELVVSVSAAFRGATDLSVGNVFGANLVNVSLVVGVAAFLGVVHIKRKETGNLVMVLLATSLISLLMVVYNPNRLAGAGLLLVYLAYVYWLLVHSGRARADAKRAPPSLHSLAPPLSKFSFFIALVIVAAQVAVDNAIALSQTWGVAETVIGATIVSLGTTLPELSVSVVSALKRRESMAIGNAVGSAITNLSLVFGTALVINPQISFAPAVQLVVFSVIANIVLLYFIVIRGGLQKRDGLLLIFGYLAFFIIQFLGGG